MIYQCYSWYNVLLMIIYLYKCTWFINVTLGTMYFSWSYTCTNVHYNDVVMGMIASQITSLTIVYSTVYSDADERKHQSSVSLAFVRGIYRWPVNSLHKGPVTQKMFTFDDVNITWFINVTLGTMYFSWSYTCTNVYDLSMLLLVQCISHDHKLAQMYMIYQCYSWYNVLLMIIYLYKKLQPKTRAQKS